MKQKEQRWYEVIEGTAYIYNAPHSDKSTSCSAVSKEQISYYRQNFDLSKVWNNHKLLSDFQQES